MSHDDQCSGLPAWLGTTELSDARLPTGAYYRQIAREIEQLAEHSQLPEVREDLHELAERFRRMAEHRERSRDE